MLKWPRKLVDVIVITKSFVLRAKEIKEEPKFQSWHKKIWHLQLTAIHF